MEEFHGGSFWTFMCIPFGSRGNAFGFPWPVELRGNYLGMPKELGIPQECHGNRMGIPQEFQQGFNWIQTVILTVISKEFQQKSRMNSRGVPLEFVGNRIGDARKLQGNCNGVT